MIMQERYRLNPEVKFRYPPSYAQRHGFQLGDFIQLREMKKSDHVRRRVIEDTVYHPNAIPGFEQPIGNTMEMLPMT